MARYYVNNNPQANGDHEVHVEGCYWLGLANNTTYLGNFTSCAPAVREAKRTYRTANGCAHCSPACHTS